MTRLKLLRLWAIAWITLLICWVTAIKVIRDAYGGYWYALYTVISGISLIILIKVTEVKKERAEN